MTLFITYRDLMKNYYRITLGKKNVYADKCLEGDFIGSDFSINQNIADKLPEDAKTFNQKFVPIFLKVNPDAGKICASYKCGILWRVVKGIKNGDIVLCPDGESEHYRVGEVCGDYIYKPGEDIPHRRPVRWKDQIIDRTDMSDALKSTIGAPVSISDISIHHEEIETLIDCFCVPIVSMSDEMEENTAFFAMEKHLEDFLVRNWEQTDLGKGYNIFEEDGVCIGQQYETDNGTIDILAISKDKKTLLVVEIKKGRAKDVVVGQILRYMGFVKEELAEEGQTVKGAIIALEDDQNLRRTIAMAQDIEFYRYQISFKLTKL